MRHLFLHRSNSTCTFISASVIFLAVLPSDVLIYVLPRKRCCRKASRGTADMHIRTKERWKWTETWLNKTCLRGRCLVLPVSGLKGNGEAPLWLILSVMRRQTNAASLTNQAAMMLGCCCQCSLLLRGRAIIGLHVTENPFENLF